ncbi:uncharacterized protein LOC113118559 isoform X2 [Carassius auratus]|uniref:Uncharacterized protein LOC113118559 isoform X2 n=1 Tax=Carassius auratus TaxID=7957 RepID=A0A6P6RDV5_CARAU|nr:uncharacterized protein LOC113118559 isoform X2 [Carassius auratus]XP_026143621.1 uncharacterized protein LOC113118559 isoform X2 [Carassius auratus]
MSKKSEKAAAEELRATLQSPLTLTITIVIVVVVAYVFMSGVGESIVGAAAGAAAGVCILHSRWEEEERTDLLAIVVTGGTGGIAGIVAAMLRSMVGERSLTGAAVVGTIAGAAIVAIAKKQLQRFIKIVKYFIVALKLFVGVTLVGLVGTLLKWVGNTVKWVKGLIKFAVSQIKAAAQWITEAAKKAFDTLASFVTSGSAAAGVIASVALASGLAATGLAPGLFGGLLGLVLVLAAGAAIFGSDGRRHSNQQQTQGADVMLPTAVFLLLVLFCFLVASLGVFRCCCLVFLFLFLWFLLCYRSERH